LAIALRHNTLFESLWCAKFQGDLRFGSGRFGKDASFAVGGSGMASAHRDPAITFIFEGNTRILSQHLIARTREPL